MKYKLIKLYPGIPESIKLYHTVESYDAYEPSGVFKLVFGINRNELDEFPEYWAPELMTSEDGHTIYEGDLVYAVCDSTGNQTKYVFTQSIYLRIHETHKIFKELSSMEDYIEKQKKASVLFVSIDGYDILPDSQCYAIYKSDPASIIETNGFDIAGFLDRFDAYFDPEKANEQLNLLTNPLHSMLSKFKS